MKDIRIKIIPPAQVPREAWDIGRGYEWGSQIDDVIEGIKSLHKDPVYQAGFEDWLATRGCAA